MDQNAGPTSNIYREDDPYNVSVTKETFKILEDFNENSSNKKPSVSSNFQIASPSTGNYKQLMMQNNSNTKVSSHRISSANNLHISPESIISLFF